MQQRPLIHPYLCFGFDDLIFMSPNRYYGDSDTHEQTDRNEFIKQGVQMVDVNEPGEPKKIKAVFGLVFRRIIKSMPAVVKTLALYWTKNKLMKKTR